jgi:ribosomal protein L16 Arg81 hydroxylase
MGSLLNASTQLCIAPLSIHEFLSHKWEREPVLFDRKDPGRFTRLISLDVFDQLVAASNLHYPCFRVFKSGDLIPLARLTTDRQVGADLDRNIADLDCVYEEAFGGATIVLQALEKSWEPITNLCIGLQEAFGAPTQAYAYHTPPRSAGPPAHYDTHDVFVLQVEGRKHWRVWPAFTNLPPRLSEDSYDHEGVLRFAKTQTPILEHDLLAGETLYIPRGFVHEADTDDARSLHVSISVMIWRWLDLFRTVSAHQLERLASELGLRRATPFGRQPGSDIDATANALFDAWVDRLSDQLNIGDAMDLMLAEHSRTCAANRRELWRTRLTSTVTAEIAKVGV